MTERIQHTIYTNWPGDDAPPGYRVLTPKGFDGVPHDAEPEVLRKLCPEGEGGSAWGLASLSFGVGQTNHVGIVVVRRIDAYDEQGRRGITLNHLLSIGFPDGTDANPTYELLKVAAKVIREPELSSLTAYLNALAGMLERLESALLPAFVFENLPRDELRSFLRAVAALRFSPTARPELHIAGADDYGVALQLAACMGVLPPRLRNAVSWGCGVAEHSMGILKLRACPGTPASSSDLPGYDGADRYWAWLMAVRKHHRYDLCLRVIGDWHINTWDQLLRKIASSELEIAPLEQASDGPSPAPASVLPAVVGPPEQDPQLALHNELFHHERAALQSHLEEVIAERLRFVSPPLPRRITRAEIYFAIMFFLWWAPWRMIDLWESEQRPTIATAIAPPVPSVLAPTTHLPRPADEPASPATGAPSWRRETWSTRWANAVDDHPELIERWMAEVRREDGRMSNADRKYVRALAPISEDNASAYLDVLFRFVVAPSNGALKVRDGEIDRESVRRSLRHLDVEEQQSLQKMVNKQYRADLKAAVVLGRWGSALADEQGGQAGDE